MRARERAGVAMPNGPSRAAVASSLTLLALVLAAIPDASSQDALGAIRGRVVTREGRPVAGVRVWLDESSDCDAAADGRFAFPDVAPGAHYLRAAATDAVDGTLAGAVQVRVPRPGETAWRELVVDREARLEVIAVPPPPEGYAHLFIGLDEPTGAGLLGGVRMAPAIPGRLAGRVFRTEDGDLRWDDHVATRAAVELPPDGGDSVEIEDGRAEVSGLSPGRYYLVLSYYIEGEPDYRALCEAVTLDEGPNRVELRTLEEGSLRVRARSGSPSVRVATEPRCAFWQDEQSLDEEWGRGMDDGVFDLPFVPPGTYHVQVLPTEGRGGLEEVVTIGPGERVTLDVDPPPARQVRVRFDGEIGGEAIVAGSPDATAGRADEDGFVVRDLAEGAPAAVVVLGWDDVTVGRADIPPDADEVRMSVGPAATVTGVVVDADGRPAGAGIEVIFAGDYQEFPSTAYRWTVECGFGLLGHRELNPGLVETRSDGSFGPARLSPGRWRIGPAGCASVDLDVALGQTYELTLRIE